MGGKDSDSLGLFRRGDEAILMQLFVREGKLIGSEHYTFNRAVEDDEKLLSTFILQYYQQKRSLPHEILLPVALKDSALIKEILKEVHGKEIPLIHPQKGNKKGLVDLAIKNAKSTYEKERDQEELREKMLLDLVEKLGLSRYPKRIECFDTSNISGSDLVASMVAYTDGKIDKARGRVYKITGIDKSDDYGALRQVLERRLKRAKEEDDLPDLLIIDGGKGQLNVGLKVLKELDIASVDIISLTKEQARHDKGLSAERVFVADRKEPITLGIRSPLLFLLQQIRDEAHDKAIGFHRKRRSKRIITTSLTDIPGIGPVKKKRLFQRFGSLRQIKNATDDELLSVAGITKKDLEEIRKII
jgi:excinuclease ABC subunit C